MNTYPLTEKTARETPLMGVICPDLSTEELYGYIKWIPNKLAIRFVLNHAHGWPVSDEMVNVAADIIESRLKNLGARDGNS